MGMDFRGLGLGAGSGGNAPGGNRWRLRELASKEHLDCKTETTSNGVKQEKATIKVSGK